MPIRRQIDNVTLENAVIRFRNFSGKEGQYNKAGDRNFAVLLDPELATAMIEQGWNVKQLKPREEGDAPQDYIQVTVKFGGAARPPKIVMITSKGRTSLGEEEVNILDWADIQTADMIIRPYNWQVNDKSGVKAYLQSIFVTINEDELDKKYADVPDSAQSYVDTPAEPAY
jgi:hypothetical protein